MACGSAWAMDMSAEFELVVVPAAEGDLPEWTPRGVGGRRHQDRGQCRWPVLPGGARPPADQSAPRGGLPMGKADPGPDGLPGLRLFQSLKGPRHALHRLTWHRAASISSRTHQDPTRFEPGSGIDRRFTEQRSKARLGTNRAGGARKRATRGVNFG